MKLKSLSIRLRLVFKQFFINVRHSHLRDLRNSFLTSLKKIPDIVHLKNLVLFGSIAAIITLALFVQRFSILRSYYFVEKPDYGGTYIQGVVGSIDKINPLFVQNEAEKAASLLVFSGLTRTIDGTKVLPDLAEKWEVRDSGKKYLFKLRQNVQWHDGKKFTADDVVYTISLIQNTDTKTDQYSIWNGVRAKKVDDYQVEFTLPAPYTGFLTAAGQLILPKHIYGEIDPKSIKVAEANMTPVGTGPYKFVRFDQLGTQPEVVFRRNDKFAISKPYIDQIKLVMFDDKKTEFESLLRKQIDGVMSISPEDFRKLSKISGNIVSRKLFPDYQIVYFNLKNTLLADKELRVALSAAVDRKELVDKVLAGNGEPQAKPLVPGQLGFSSKVKGIGYDVNVANSSLDKAGWKKDKEGIRIKDGKRLSFRLVSPDNYESREVAKLLKIQFLKIGVNLDVEFSDEEQIGPNYIRSRNFDLLLINQNVGFNQDWYSLWDSTQVASPGLNLSGFSDKKLDRFVQQVRSSNDKAYKSERMKEAEQIIIENAPVIYLYRPLHLSAISEKVKGTEQSRLSSSLDVLNNIYSWYIRVRG